MSRLVIRHDRLVTCLSRLRKRGRWSSEYAIRFRQNGMRICVPELSFGELRDPFNKPMARVGELRDPFDELKARVGELKSKTSLPAGHLDPNRNQQAQEDARGSIAPLIFTYFTIAMTLIFIVSNVAATYVARRELTNRVEGSMLRAAQELDQVRYYYGGPTTDFLAQQAIDEGSLLVPIDCPAASQTFSTTLAMYSAVKRSTKSARYPHTHSAEIPKSSKNDPERHDRTPFSDWKPQITSFRCEGNRIAAIVTERFELPFQIPLLGITTFENQVEVSAESVYE